MAPIIFDVVVIEKLHHGRSSHAHSDIIPSVVHDLWPGNGYKCVANGLSKQFLSGFRLIIDLVAKNHSV